MVRLALSAVVVAAIVAGCAGSRPAHWSSVDSYVVRPGDTLYSIAFRHGVDWRSLARWNDIDPPGYLIKPGQTLRLDGPSEPRVQVTRSVRAAQPTATTPPAIAPRDRIGFIWPSAGEIVTRFDANVGSKGIAIAGREGQPIVAAGAGRVVYSGSGLVGYGRLIIIKHDNRFLSAYGHNKEILVAEGDEVKSGQRIATMGEGPGRRAMLHFEIRADGRAVDPLEHLPVR